MNNLQKLIVYGSTIGSLLIPKFANAQTITKHYFDNPNKTEIVEGLEKTTAKEIINPFVQPNDSTLNWYGSGDANNDGKVDNKDVGKLDSLINGTYQNPSDKRLKDRVDINGDGVITIADKQTLENYLNGTIPYLPSQWNKLLTREERKNWIKKMFVIDKIDTLHGSLDWVCSEFAIQTHINFHGYNDNIPSKFDTTNNGRFNLPVYSVYIRGPPNWGNHAINTTLIGDEPLNWNDLYWVEPQNDKPVIIGQWNLNKDSSEVWIEKINILWNDGYGSQDFIKFSIKDSAATCTFQDTGNVQLTRPIVNSVKEIKHKEEIVKYFLLEQNFPNPFNGSTTIRYKILKESEVDLTIYNLLGQELERIVKEHQTQGEYEYEWTPKKDVASGIKIYKLQAGDFIKSKEMIYLK